MCKGTPWTAKCGPVAEPGGLDRAQVFSRKAAQTCQAVLSGKSLSLNFGGAKKTTKLWGLVSIRIPTGI